MHTMVALVSLGQHRVCGVTPSGISLGNGWVSSFGWVVCVMLGWMFGWEKVAGHDNDKALVLNILRSFFLQL